MQLTAADRRILAVLQQDSSLSMAELAERVGLSPSPCWRRVQKLRQQGVIRAEVALVDRASVGLKTQIFAQVKLSAQGSRHLDEFAAAIRRFPEVLECWVLMGPVDFLLRIVAPDVESYERFFFEHLSRVPGVQEITSTVALSEIKATTALPIPPGAD